MKIFKISQNVNNEYDTYDSAIVIAESKEEAKKIHPNGDFDYKEEENITSRDNPDQDTEYGTWVKKKCVKVEYIGEAKKGIKKGVVCASFHAG